MTGSSGGRRCGPAATPDRGCTGKHRHAEGLARNRVSDPPRRDQGDQAGMVPVAAGAGPAPARPRPGADPTVLAGLGQTRPGVTKVNAGPAARHATLQVS